EESRDRGTDDRTGEEARGPRHEHPPADEAERLAPAPSRRKVRRSEDRERDERQETASEAPEGDLGRDRGQQKRPAGRRRSDEGARCTGGDGGGPRGPADHRGEAPQVEPAEAPEPEESQDGEPERCAPRDGDREARRDPGRYERGLGASQIANRRQGDEH